jgi:hypothetical protein
MDMLPILTLGKSILVSEAVALGYAWKEYKKQVDKDLDDEIDPEEWDFNKFAPLGIIALGSGLVYPVAATVVGLPYTGVEGIVVQAMASGSVNYVANETWKFIKVKLNLEGFLDKAGKALFSLKDFFFKVKKEEPVTPAPAEVKPEEKAPEQ